MLSQIYGLYKFSLIHGETPFGRTKLVADRYKAHLPILNSVVVLRICNVL